MRGIEHHMKLTLPLRIVLSVLSGIGVGAIGEYGFFGVEHEPGLYLLTGLAFAAGVLFPYLDWEKHVWLRALVLVTASALSYYCAIWLAVEQFFGVSEVVSFTIASVVGAAIVLAAFIIVTPARISRPFILFGLTAGLIGGPITWATLLDRGVILAFAGHAIWHTLICLAIHFGTRTRRP